MFRIFLTNLGKYNEGELVGEWVELPCEDFADVYKRIGINFDEPIDGIWYEETFITDYENDYGVEVGEYENLEHLNELAERLEGCDEDVISALLGELSDTEEALEIYEDGNYMFYGGIDTVAELVEQQYTEDGRLAEIEKYLDPAYIDWEGLARDWEANGHFIECDNGIVEYWW